MCQTYQESHCKWPSKNKRPIVALDMDDVITACLRSFIKRYNEKHNTNIKPSQINLWSLQDCLGCGLNDVMAIFREPTFFEDLPAKPSTVSTIRNLIKSEKYDIYIITATSDDDGSEFEQKIKWLKTYIPEFNIKRLIACQDKYIIRADVLVDDKIENLDSVAEFGTKCVIQDSPTNKDCDKYIRIHTLKELPAILDSMFFNDGNGVKDFTKHVEPVVIEKQLEADKPQDVNIAKLTDKILPVENKKETKKDK